MLVLRQTQPRYLDKACPWNKVILVSSIIEEYRARVATVSVPGGWFARMIGRLVGCLIAFFSSCSSLSFFLSVGSVAGR